VAGLRRDSRPYLRLPRKWWQTWANPTLAIWAAGLFASAGGVCLLVGLLTPLASVLLGLSGLGAAGSHWAAPASDRTGTGLTALFVVIVSGAIAYLPPGAFSVDSGSQAVRS